MTSEGLGLPRQQTMHPCASQPCITLGLLDVSQSLHRQKPHMQCPNGQRPHRHKSHHPPALRRCPSQLPPTFIQARPSSATQQRSRLKLPKENLKSFKLPGHNLGMQDRVISLTRNNLSKKCSTWPATIPTCGTPTCGTNSRCSNSLVLAPKPPACSKDPSCLTAGATKHVSLSNGGTHGCEVCCQSKRETGQGDSL